MSVTAPTPADVRAAATVSVRSAGSIPATLYHCTVMHRRSTTVDRSFRYSTCYWLVDVDDLPVLPRILRPFAAFRSGDHLGDPAAPISANIRALLTASGVAADRILLLTTPRVAGHAFNPLSAFYCYSGPELVAVVAEVHNTYHGRHTYVLRPDEAGRDDVQKRFYVSPFLPMGGRYLMRTPSPGDRLTVSIALHRDGRTPFVATLQGRGRPATMPAVVGSMLRWPLLATRTSLLIRWQGIRLWARGIPVQPRPPDAAGDETAR